MRRHVNTERQGCINMRTTITSMGASSEQQSA